MKKLIAVIMTFVIACQSLPLSIFANNAEITDILDLWNDNEQVVDGNDEDVDAEDDINNTCPSDSPNESPFGSQSGSWYEPSANNSGSFNVLEDTPVMKICEMLNIDVESAERMILSYGNADSAVLEAENYAMLKKTFYALDYADVRNTLTELVVSGNGSQRVAYSAIIACALNADICEVMLKDEEQTVSDDIFVDYFVQQFYVSPAFVLNYTAEHGISAEIMYDLVMRSLRAMYPSEFSVSTISDDPYEKTPEYPDSPFFTNISENESISPVSGALTYSMDLAAIPGINGMDINLSLRYDSDKSVVQGEYRVISDGQGTPVYGSDGRYLYTKVEAWVAHYYIPYSWANKSPFIFGTGWRLNFDYIYRRDNQLYLELADGREYKITGTSPNYTLTGYNTDSLTLKGSGTGNTSYTLTFADGTVETFDPNGDLISKTDRFGNTLSFIHTKITEPIDPSNPNGGTYTDRLTITDTYNTVLIDYNLDEERITLPDGSAIHFSYIHENNDYLLTEITDQEGKATAFTYQSSLCGLDDYDVYSETALSKSHVSYQYEKLYYNYLTNILYPTGDSTTYSYNDLSKYVTHHIDNRSDVINGIICNPVTYYYSFGAYKSTAKYGTKEVEYTFNSDGFVTKETIISDHKVKEWVERVYDTKLGLPTKITTAKAAPNYGEVIGADTWDDGHGHSGGTPIFDTTSFVSKVDTYEYNTVGQITKQVVDGITTTNTYDDRFYLVKQSISSGSDGITIKTTNTLTSDGKSIANSRIYYNNVLAGRSNYTYDTRGDITAIRKYINSGKYITTKNTYTANGWISSTSTSGVTINYTYDPMGRITSETDGNGNVTLYQYDKLGRVIEEAYPNGAVKTYKYTVQSGKNETVITDELGYSTIYNYNGFGNITSVYSSGQCLESIEYDPYMRVLNKTDANGAYITYAYDYADRVIEINITDPGNDNAAYRETYDYEVVLDSKLFKTQKTVPGDTNAPSITQVNYSDIYGNLKAEGFIHDSIEITNEYTYDSFGNKTSELTAKDKSLGLSFTNEYSYDINGNITSVRNSRNQYTYAAYDWLGNMLTQTDLLGNVTSYTYDDFGRVLTKTVPIDASNSLIVTYNYDKNGNLISEKYPVNINTVNAIGEAIYGGTDTLFKITEYTYDKRNNLIEVKQYSSSSSPITTASYTYDAKGQMLTSTTGDYTTKYSYDERGNVASIVYPGGRIETFKYNAADNVIESTDRNGVTAKYVYDCLGNPISISAGGKTISYAYTATGSLLSETSESSDASYKYDDLGRIISETSGGTATTYTYDLAGNVTSISTNGVTTDYTYDNLNRLVKVVSGTTSAEYTYDAAGRRTDTTVCNNSRLVSATSYAYNYVGNITSQKNYNAGGKLLSEFSYTYDLNGNVLSEYDSTTKKTTNYVYDILGRLVSETDGGSSRYYAYDVAGNRSKAIIDTTTTISYNYDSDGRLISETSNNGQTSAVTTYAYDNNGNLISKTENGKTTKYVFDVWGNMTSAAGASYTYNTQGLRTSKTVSGKKTSFTLVGGSVWSDGTSNYIWGAELITNGSVYYIYNAHGDVIQLIDVLGNIVKTYDYDAYGNELERDLSDTNPFRYCGEYYDIETGFIYLRARYYDPNTGRFISEDPIRDGLNWYSYCDGNPVNYTDSTGMSSFLDILIKYGLNFSLKVHNQNSKFMTQNQNYHDLLKYYATEQLTQNRKTKPESHRNLGYINNQYLETGPCSYYTYGTKNAVKNSCEVIAVYNALLYLEQKRNFEDIMYDFYSLGALVFNGDGGTNPYSIGRVLDEYGLRYKEVGRSDMTADGMYIMSFWTGSVLDKSPLHTVAVLCSNGKYIAYNNKGTNALDYRFSPDDYKWSNFVCAYYLGNKEYQMSLNLMESVRLPARK